MAPHGGGGEARSEGARLRTRTHTWARPVEHLDHHQRRQDPTGSDPNDAGSLDRIPAARQGDQWKTLDEVDAVIVASVNSKEEPETVEVFIFPADEVRKRFGEAYAARKQAGRVIRDNYGMWVALHYPERISRSAPNAIGSGIADEHKPIAVYSIEKLLAENSDRLAAASEDDEVAEALERAEASEPHFTTIAQVMTWAREQVAEIAGVRLEAVKLDLKLNIDAGRPLGAGSNLPAPTGVHGLSAAPCPAQAESKHSRRHFPRYANRMAPRRCGWWVCAICCRALALSPPSGARIRRE